MTGSSYPPEHGVFENNETLSNNYQSPGVMGTCHIHDGTVVNPCIPNPSHSTVDIVPRNFELCIDTNTNNVSSVCDPNSSIPVYAPRGGCATFTDPEDDPGTPGNENRPPSVIIRVTRSGSQTECNTPAQNDDLFIVLTHIIRDSSIPIAPGNPLPITAGHRVGYMCLSAEAVNPCEVANSSTPTHLAFQLQIFSGGFDPAPNDILGYLARLNCLYDDWLYSPGSPQRQPTQDQLRACPSI